MNRREFVRRSAVAAAAGAVGVGLYTWRVEPHWVKVVERDLPIANLPDALADKRLVQISDLHIGPRVDDDYLIGAFARAQALQPDIVVITGDFLTYRYDRGDVQYDQLRSVLSHLPHGRAATVGILGNHDYGRGWSEPVVGDRVAREAERAGVHLLRNDVASVRGLDVIGVDDLWARRANAQDALRQRTSEAAIVLCHNPDGVDRLAWGDYRGWILSGHTHGGQCKPPFLPPPLVPVENKLYTAGEIAIGNRRRLYINRGLGHLIRVRFNVRPEITSFTLKRAAV